MIQPNWDIFSSKFSNNKEKAFEWFSYLLFCREFNLPKGWFGFQNQSGIEKNPIEYGEEVIGFQAKFYSTRLSDHKDDFLKMLENSKRDYPKLTKILIYTNLQWGQGFSHNEDKMKPSKALIDIENKAKEFDVILKWKDTSFFESEFVCLKHDDISRHFFTEQTLKGWQRLDDWSNTKAKLEDTYFIDNDVKVIVPNHQNKNEVNIVEGINEIRIKLKEGGSSVRLVGLSGVGKTRFAQALFDQRIGENCLDHKIVWYCDLGNSPIPSPIHFIDELVQKEMPYVLIVDNCGQDTHANLTNKIQNSKIALMTIEYDVRDDLPERTDVYKLKPVSADIIKKVIERHYPEIKDLNINKIAEFSGGNYRLALAIASNVEKKDNLALLTDNQLFERLFWQKGQRNDELFKIAQNFALVYSFNIEDSGEENSELIFLANLAKVESDTAISVIERLKARDIVQKRGEWRAILPHALANHLAKDLIANKLISQLNDLALRMPERLQTSFIKRLSYLHDVPKIIDLVYLWFRNDGWLGKKILDDTYNSQDLVKIRLLSVISEDQLLKLLEHKHILDPEFLTRKNSDFIELSRLIRSLAYQEHNFIKAVQLLVHFCKSEKDSERNNSIMDLLTTLFSLYFSETLASLECKKEAITIMQDNFDNQHILLSILSKALNFHESGYLVRESNQNGKISDYGYQPKTYDELWSWVGFLLGVLNELDIQGVSQARKIFTNNLKEIIWTCGKVEFVRKYLEKFNEREYFPEAHTQVLNIIKWNRQELFKNAPDLLDDLEALEKYLRPKASNVRELIKSYILVSDHDLYRMTKIDDEYAIDIPDFYNYQEFIDYLSQQLQDIHVLKENLDLLIKASSGWNEHGFLIQLGQNCVQGIGNIQELLNILEKVSVDEELTFSEFLLGILNKLKEVSISDFFESINIILRNDNLKNLASMTIFQTCKTDDDFLYFTQLIRDERFNKLNLPRISAHKYHNRINNKNFEKIIDVLIEKNEWVKVIYELSEECSFQKNVSQKYIPILLKNISSIISNESFFGHSEDVLKFLITLDDDTQNFIFNNVKDFLSSESYIWLHREDKKFKMLKLLIDTSTRKFIEYFIEDKKIIKKFFDKGLAKILVYSSSLEVLNWINKDQAKIDFWGENSRLYLINENKSSIDEKETKDIDWLDLILNLFDLSIDKANLLDLILNHQVFSITGVVSGSWSQGMRSRLPYLYSLRIKLAGFYPELLDLIDIREKEWLQQIERQAERDSEEERLRNERFDW
ncbi:hypothetical protein [Acinetobacter bereziniae]|uniref:hypothetical protein n=1 Tax=Acinetobacter bereziniae TaxID=106648 RepID=UPI00124FDCA8|nr:hypothetical protein [Acinetobacter bereziniae]